MAATDVAEKAHAEWLAHRVTTMARRDALIDEQRAWGVVIAAIKRAWRENEEGT